MKINKFWESWDDISEIERQAGIVTQKALEYLFFEVQEEKIYAIYVKGSFATREMIPSSDIDIQVVVKENEDIQKVLDVKKKFREEISPADLIPISLWEFENNKRFLQDGKTKASPDNFLRWLPKHKLVFGKDLDPSQFVMRTDKEALQSLIKAFREVFIPLFEKKGEFFSDTLKEVFWLAALEQKIKGHLFDNWKDLSQAYPQGHVVRCAYKYRHNKISEDEKQKVIDMIKEYLKEIEERY